MSKTFGRVYDLSLSDGAGIVRRFDGFPTEEHTPLQITFSVDQTPVEHRSIAEIVISGVNRQSRRNIYEQFTNVVFQAGFRNNYGVIFNGQIENVEIGREAQDTFVKLFCQSSVDIWNTVNIEKTWGENTPQKTIIGDVAATFGVPVEFIGNFDDLTPAIKGRTLDGDSKYIMNQLANSFDFDWFVSGGRMLIVKEGADRPDGQVFNYKPTNGLIGSPEITQQGVNIEVLLNPRIRPWDLYTVESETAQLTFNGIYYKQQQFPKTNGESLNRIISFVHEGDFYGDTWTTSIEGRFGDG